ncbi:MAG: phosphopantetheine-binding protein [Streptosporangiaceae bacterium]
MAADVPAHPPAVPWDSQYEEILRPHLPAAAPVDPLRSTDDLRELGLDSMGTIHLLLDLESRYRITFPDELLNADTFASVGGLWSALAPLIGGGTARP